MGQSGDTTAPLEDATESELAVSPASTTAYWVRIGSIDGVTVDSATATVTVDYTLTSTAGSGGSITRSPNLTQYSAGAVVTLRAAPSSGYVFTGWSGALSGDAASQTLTMNSNQTVGANFREMLVPEIVTEPGSATITSGGTTTLGVSASNGSSYQWYVGQSGDTTAPLEDATESELAVSPASTTAYWVRIGSIDGVTVDSATATVTVDYTLTSTAGSGGSITRSPNLTQYSAGAVVTLRAAPSSGYVFTGWSGALSGDAASQTLTMNSNHTVGANFAIVERPEISVSYEGVDIDNDDSSPSSIEGTDFGSVEPLLGSVSRTYRVHNTGNARLNLGEATSNSPDFTVDGLSSSIEAGAYDDFTVTFAPDSTGLKSAIILFTTNDTSSTPFSFAVSGSRLVPGEPFWEPVGWVYYAWPYAYSANESRWYFFNAEDQQWRVNLSTSQWGTLTAATGWNYYAWPYSYSIDQMSWHWYNLDVQWLIDLQAGEWMRLGRSGD